jgi:putative nucleotidyltransferase with HDIG domain
MPQTLLGAIEMMNSAGDVDVDAVVKLIETDPAVVTRVLRIANSAFAAQRAEITSMRRAAVVLGPTAILGMVMSMGFVEMKASFDAEVAGPFFDLVRHSIATAVIARMMADDDGATTDEAAEAFSCGLLHDIGKLVLLYNSAAQAIPLYRSGLFGYALMEQEDRVFGTTHTRIGAAVADRLRLPEPLRNVMQHHHATNGTATDAGNLAALIRASDLLAHALGFPQHLKESAQTMAASVDLDHWQGRTSEIEQYVNAVV